MKKSTERIGEYNSSRYDDPRFWHRRYHAKRFGRVLNILNQVVNEDYSFLDAGTGTGEYLASCEGHVERAVGVDISFADLRRARNLCGADVDAVQADIAKLPFKESSFDVVLCSEVLEHIPNLDGGVSELFRVARNTLVITMPCISGIRKGLRGIPKRVFGVDLREREQTVGHINMLPFNQVAEKFRCSGWSVEARTWYIFCEPMATYPIPSILSPCIALAEKMLDWLFPRAGNHAAIICRKNAGKDELPQG